jgi:signal transduction histidine kinase
MNQDVALVGSSSDGPPHARRLLARLREFVPSGNTLDEPEWRRRHRILEWVLLLHLPALAALGFALGHPVDGVVVALVPPLVFLVLGHLVRPRRWASFFVTGGLVFCSIALVLLTQGTIEAHFHFFAIIGFIALYQDWVPFLWNVGFTVLSHGVGTAWLGGPQIFNHPAAQGQPWLWSFVHGIAVLAACVGVVIFWRLTEEDVGQKARSLQQVTASAEAEIGRRQFTADLLVNLARRNQSMIYRQLDIINQLEDKERDPDALSDLFRLDHLATRVRRNAESLLVLAGEQAPRSWTAPVALRDVVRAAIAETEDLDRVVFAVDDRAAVSGSAVADLTHLLAELTENAVRFSPPETAVTIRTRPNRRDEGGQLLTVEDWGVGMPPDDLAAANDLLSHPPEVDLSASQRLGFHVVARLAARHSIAVSLTSTPGSGITAVVVLPAALFTTRPVGDAVPSADTPFGTGAGDPAPVPADVRRGRDTDVVPVEATATREPDPRDGGVHPAPRSAVAPGTDPAGRPDTWRGWWSPDMHGAGPSDGSLPAAAANGHAANGHGTDGHAANGHAANGLGTNGHGAGAPGTNGHAANGHAANGHGANGHGAGGGATRRDVEAQGPPAAASSDPVNRPWPVPHPSSPASPLRVPETRQAWAAPIRADQPAGAAPAPLSVPAVSRDVEVSRPAEESGPALPIPRADAATPGADPRATPKGRALRRRVPQSHLAPELRHPVASGVVDSGPVAPMSADAAATALSRYQASRQAAQSVVDAGPIDGGGRP